MGGSRDSKDGMILRYKVSGARQMTAAKHHRTLRFGAWVSKVLRETTQKGEKNWKWERKKPLLTPVLLMRFKRREAMLLGPNVP